MYIYVSIYMHTRNTPLLFETIIDALLFLSSSFELTPTDCGARGCGNGGGMELVAGVVMKHPGGRPEKQGEVSRTTA